jgi:hypothetical protein
VTAGFFLRHDRNLESRSFPFDRDGFFRFLKPFDVTLDGVLGHGSRVIQVFALGCEAGQRWNSDRIPTMFFRVQKRRVFMGAILAVLHESILDQMLNDDILWPT